MNAAPHLRMTRRNTVAIVIAVVAVIGFVKDDELKGDARRRVYGEARSTLSRAEFLDGVIARLEANAVQAEALVQKATSVPIHGDKLEQLRARALQMKDDATVKKDRLTMERAELIRRYNELRTRYNELPRSLFHEPGDAPRSLAEHDL